MLFLINSCSFLSKKNRSDSSPHLDWLRGRISKVKISKLKGNSNKAFQIPLNVVRNRDSSWKKREILFLIGESQKIIDQCEKFGLAISFFPITLIELNHPLLNKLHYHDDYLFTQDLPSGLVKPVVIFTEKSRYSWGGYANRAEVLMDEKKKGSYGVVFVLRGITRHHASKYNYSYKGILAHEVLHVLLEEEPNDLPGNILNHNLKTGGTNLTESQCEKIVNHPLVRKEA